MYWELLPITLLFSKRPGSIKFSSTKYKWFHGLLTIQKIAYSLFKAVHVQLWLRYGASLHFRCLFCDPMFLAFSSKKWITVNKHKAAHSHLGYFVTVIGIFIKSGIHRFKLPHTELRENNRSRFGPCVNTVTSWEGNNSPLLWLCVKLVRACRSLVELFACPLMPPRSGMRCSLRLRQSIGHLNLAQIYYY